MLSRLSYRGKVVCELGAGCGLPGLAVAVYCDAKSVYITDIHEPTLRNAVHNVRINARKGGQEGKKEGEEGEEKALLIEKQPFAAEEKEQGKDEEGGTQTQLGSAVIGGGVGGTVAAVSNVSWTEEGTYPKEPVDVVLGSDLVYDAALPALLGQVSSYMSGYMLLGAKSLACRGFIW